MLVGEVSEKTGIPKKTLYFYEQEDLIHPEFQENGYRSYNEKDVEKLQIILQLREIGVSLADIRSYFEDISKEKVILEKYLVKLEEEKQDVERQIEVCKRLLKNDVSSYVANEYQVSQSKRSLVYPIVIGNDISRKRMFLSLLYGFIFSFVLIFFMIPAGLPRSMQIVVMLIIFIVSFGIIPTTSFIFLEDGVLFPRKIDRMFDAYFRVINLLKVDGIEKEQVAISYTDIIDAEVVWSKGGYMKGWTIPKVWVTVHTKTHGSFTLDSLAIDNASVHLPEFMYVLTEHQIPIFDPHRIIQALEGGMKLSEYAEQLEFGK